MKSNSFSFYFWHIAAFVVMLVIFIFSSQSGEVSTGTSSGMIYTLLGNPQSDYAQFMQAGDISPYASAEYLLRKTAHFLEYSVLGFCVTKAALCYKINLADVICFAIAICSAYALSDEIHQLFIANRSGNLGDVLIDISGVYSGLFTAIILRSINWLPKYNNI